MFMFVFFFTNTATTKIYTLSLHDALPISHAVLAIDGRERPAVRRAGARRHDERDRKSTRLNSSHRCISYAVFCLKKKKTQVVDRSGRPSIRPPLGTRHIPRENN